MSDIDPEIPRRAKRGDRQAFAQLVDYFYPRGLRFAQQMLGNAQDAEEALQDTFVRVYDNLSKFREDSRFEPWLFRILANRCRTLAAKQQRHYAVVEYGDLPIDAAAEGETRDEWTAEVYGALDRLPAEQREAFLLRHVAVLDDGVMPLLLCSERAAAIRENAEQPGFESGIFPELREIVVDPHERVLQRFLGVLRIAQHLLGKPKAAWVEVVHELSERLAVTTLGTPWYLGVDVAHAWRSACVR